MRSRTKKRIFWLCLFLVGSYIFSLQMCKYLRKNKKDPTTWSECEKIISERSCCLSFLEDWICANEKPTDQDVFSSYIGKDCEVVKREQFPHPTPTQEEKDFPIAYAMVVFQNANLAEKVLQSVYMPQNIYCIHVDVKSSETFRHAMWSMTSCLDNVFLTTKAVDLIWAHVSTLHAQLNCVSDLMASPVKWKYFMHISGQEYPLYQNAEIVRALSNLNGFNNIESFSIPPSNWERMLYSHKVQPVKGGEFHKRYELRKTDITKQPPPWGINLKKGSNFVALTREAANFILQNKVAIDFLAWLNDTVSPDEAFYSSLQQHPGFPGGIQGDQPEWIMRAVSWKFESPCYGRWIRYVCWLTTRDLSWVLTSQFRNKLFVTKIPFDYRDDLIKCLSLSRSARKYGQVLIS